ncbi:MAG: FtsW/RodA/SpoVE family cell cycle protein [Bacilli bacterium]|nr:FtsW/RodA/SpoVE family cell cycle protein [Bacilli bacterium]
MLKLSYELERGDKIKNVSKFKVENSILISLILFGIISVVSIYCTKGLLRPEFENYWIKQIIWYIVGFGVAYFMMVLGNKFLYNNAWWFYLIGIVSLVLVLIIGKEINSAKCWFNIKYIGTIQPSEFMKVFLIIILSRLIRDFNDEHSNPSVLDEFKFLFKILIIVLIPSLLTFIEPDTGAVIIYFIITFVMLFVGGIRKRWFFLIFIALGSIISVGGLLYLTSHELFLKIFGTSLLYRIDRIVNWSSSSGMQLTNSLTAIGSAGVFGHGFTKTPIYFPEMQTDFIFSVFVSNFGLLGASLLIIILLFFDFSIIHMVSKANDITDKFAIGGIIAVLVFQQIQNISMTIGLLPIMGITLPFISYGGSSLLSYMMLVGMIFNISNENLRFTN